MIIIAIIITVFFIGMLSWILSEGIEDYNISQFFDKLADKCLLSSAIASIILGIIVTWIQVIK